MQPPHTTPDSICKASHSPYNSEDPSLPHIPKTTTPKPHDVALTWLAGETAGNTAGRTAGRTAGALGSPGLADPRTPEPSNSTGLSRVSDARQLNIIDIICTSFWLRYWALGDPTPARAPARGARLAETGGAGGGLGFLQSGSSRRVSSPPRRFFRQTGIEGP